MDAAELRLTILLAVFLAGQCLSTGSSEDFISIASKDPLPRLT